MTLLVLCSASGAPGVTTTALALGWVWPLVHPERRALVVDADPTGSGVLPGYLRAGVVAGGGVLALAAERSRPGPGAFLDEALGLDPAGTRMVLLGFTATAQARTVAPVWEALADAARALNAAGVDVVVDAGRLGHRYEPTVLLQAADAVAVVLASSLRAVTTTAAALRDLGASRRPGSRTTAAVVGERRPYSAREISAELEVEPLPAVAVDPWAAGALAEAGSTGWRFERSVLLRSVRDLAQHLRIEATTVPAAVGS
ncbi:hypothetical protein [Cellulomonas cellasea]|uniref:MinD-like ATPase involved in chromosome partitioning or flagellar assembly n=1 Tax=Cellulomonas cellasea TaxID=43670 RepID=A0A7W4UC19_9CELL|nr:hypothetical protein [Cellulomonas cellasea]MBB2921329.1 hypothetical protein [Cellulomonas cellasea]